MSKKIGLLAIAPLAAMPVLVTARGVSPYLPLNLDPEVERQIERVLILGDKPMLRRPIPAAVVLDALPKACKVDAVLCEHVQKYLERYMRNTGLEFLSIEASAGTGSDLVMPNAHGQTEQSRYQFAFAGYLQLNDYALVNLGGVAYEGRAPTATGSFASIGWDAAQLDIGYRDHWWSPMTNSAMLISTEASTMPSVTLSNYRPLTRLGIDYELFTARMSYSDKIYVACPQYQGESCPQLTAGYPKFSGVHLGIEPASGVAFSANRVLIYGGGAAGGQSIGNIFDAFFNPSKAQTTGFGAGQPVVGKQEAAVTSQFIFPGRIPFTVYAEYTGNDTSYGQNYLFGKPDFSFGIHFPRLGPFDLTLENSLWAPTWYVHGYSNVQTGYGDGISNHMLSIGNWFGDQRIGGESLLNGDAVGGGANLVRLGFEPSFGGLFEGQLRTLRNDSVHYGIVSNVAYYREYMASLSYSYPWRGYAVGAEIGGGRDVFGSTYARLAGFMRFGEALRGAYPESDTDSLDAQRAKGAELFVDVGANVNRVYEQIVITSRVYTQADYGPHLGIGARRQVSPHQDLGVRLEADDIRGKALLSFRALDYRYRFSNPLAVGVFAGATRYYLATPAFGWYVGAGAQWREILHGWDLGLDWRYGVKVARLRTLPSDPQQNTGVRPDSFYDIYGLALYMSRKF
jgi:hypothetical protein